MISKPSAHLALAIPLLIFGLVAHAPEASAATAAEMAAQARASAQAQAAQARTSAQAQAAQARADALARAGREPTPPPPPPPAPVPPPPPTPAPPPPPARDTTPPSVPTGLIASAVSCSAIQVSWNASTDTGGSGLAGYDVYRDGNFYTQVFAPLRGLVDTDLPPSMTQSYRVAGFDGQGNRSARSADGSASTPSCPVPGGSSLPRLIASGAPGSGIYNRDIAVDESRDLAVVVVAGGQGGPWLQVIDLGNPLAPSVVGALASPRAGAFSAAIAGDFAFVTIWAVESNQAELVIVDLRNPSRPAIAARVVVPGFPTAGQVVVQGSLAYVAASDAGLRIYDVANPLAPRFLGTAPTPGPHRGLAVSQGYAYYTGDHQLVVFDVRDATRPETVYTFGLQRGGGATVANGMVYVIDNQQLLIFDISEPRRPVLRSGFTFNATDVAVAGDKLFLSGRVLAAQGVAVVDTTTRPPKLVDHIDTPGGIGSLIATEGFLYAGDDVSAIDIIQLRP